MSPSLERRFPCLVGVKQATEVPKFASKLAGFRWAVDTWLPKSNRDLVFNADEYNNAVKSQVRHFPAQFPPFSPF